MKKSFPLFLALLATTTFGRASDWPQWRGPNRDAVVADAKHPLTTLPKEPKTLWSLPVGNGQASPVVVGAKLIYLDERAGQETAHCIDLGAGKELWKTAYAEVVELTGEYGNGPRCTPLVDGDRVYVQSCGGEFRCLALADGKTLWGVSFGKNYGATFLGNKSSNPEAKETASRRHGNNGSAIVDGDRIFVPVGSVKGATLVCFDKKTGKEIWRAGNDNTAYSSLMVGTLAGVRQVVHLTADALMGVDAASGKILWRVPVKTGAKRHACTPVLAGDTITIASTSIGTIKFKVSKAGSDFKAEQVWANLPVKTVIATPVLVNGQLYTLGAGGRADFVCLDFNDGKQQWAQPGFGDYASITAVQDKLLVLTSSGELCLVKANPAKYEELGRVQVCGKTWSSPAYADGRLYVKDGTKLLAVQLANSPVLP